MSANVGHELERVVESLKEAENIYEETTKIESAEYARKSSAMAKELFLLTDRKAKLKAKLEENERRIEQIVQATNAESESKVLKDLEESKIRATDAQKREIMLKEKLAKTKRLLEEKKLEKRTRQLEAKDKERHNAALIEAAIKYTGLEMVSVAETEDTIRFEFKHIDKSDPQKIFYFTLCLTEDSSYRLLDCQPPLPTINAHFDKVNADRDLYSFVKAIRKDFVEYEP